MTRMARMDSCEFWLTHDEEWFERVLWSDETWFVLHPSPNKKNTVCWLPENPNKLVPCKKAQGQKVMAWVGVVEWKCLPVHWFTGSVNSDAYLEMLQTVVWPAVRARATCHRYWFQQDGAPPHVTAPVMDFLHSKFGGRVISRNSEHRWPPYSPDLSCLDFCFWSLVTAQIVHSEPQTLEQLKELVEDFARNMDDEQLRKMAGAVLLQVQGGVEKVIAYGSQKLSKSQMNYGTTQKELLAVVIFVQKFSAYLE
ncbi:uncharacterized protein LOC122376980, partial [Amphibalanus amphitrite]|uniref:uncharacterized protein LOC122376980 n=1 Tax=Amphibalanus amphitrite TaxID=1232801 RepID=UPI001C9077AE